MYRYLFKNGDGVDRVYKSYYYIKIVKIIYSNLYTSYVKIKKKKKKKKKNKKKNKNRIGHIIADLNAE